MKTTAMVPSVFLKAETTVLAGAPEAPTLTASGLTYLENIAKAHKLPDGVTTVDEPEPVKVTRPAALLFAWAPIFLLTYTQS
jgi:hypothetical protein